MTYLITVAVIVVILVSIVVVYFGIVGLGVATYKASGYVKTDSTALPGVSIAIDGKSTMTDSNGYFEITGLSGNASYTLSVSKTGYESYEGALQIVAQNVEVADIILKAEEVSAPLTKIQNALAAQEGVSTDDVELYFWEAAAEADNYAIGAVISQQKSIVCSYIESTDTITTENSYTATGDGLTAMTTLCGKQVLSRFTGHRIVPFDFDKKDGVYSFHYFDGYDGILKRWGFGAATLSEEGDVPTENMTHSWI